MYAWIVLLRSEGVVNHALVAIGVPRLPLLYNDFAVLVGQVYGELPFMIIPLYVSIEKLDAVLLEAAADCGAAPSEPSAASSSPDASGHRRRLRAGVHPRRSARTSRPICSAEARPPTSAT